MLATISSSWIANYYLTGGALGLRMPGPILWLILQNFRTKCTLPKNVSKTLPV